jgi:hypothetical protein
MLDWLFKKSKPLTYGDKIDKIINSDIDLKLLYRLESDFIFNNIDRYIEVLEEIMKQDILNSYIETVLVSGDKINHISYLEFLSTDGRIPVDPIRDIKRLLEVFKKFDSYFNIYSGMKQDVKLSVNLRTIQLHIIYIRRIVDQVYSSIK